MRCMALLRRKKPPSGRMLLVHLNARMQPMHRGDIFEDPLEDHLAARGLSASVVGGGTMLAADGEPESCDVEVEVAQGSGLDEVVAAITSFLESRNVPRGSNVQDENGRVLAAFGVVEGLALYLNGTELPAEVYANSDVNELIEAIHVALGPSGAMLSYWEGPRDTVLYLYGPNAEAMRTRLTPLLAERPDAQLSRLVSIA
jgi:hypothetical protein